MDKQCEKNAPQSVYNTNSDVVTSYGMNRQAMAPVCNRLFSRKLGLIRNGFPYSVIPKILWAYRILYFTKIPFMIERHGIFFVKTCLLRHVRSINLTKIQPVAITSNLRHNNAIFVITVKLELCVTFGFNKASILETLD